MFKIDNKDSRGKPAEQEKESIDHDDEICEESGNSENSGSKPEKIETCYFCLQKFDMNKDDLSHYKYGKFPMCDYCSQFYGFYGEE